VIGLLVLMAEL